jgi:hypothetical protein
MEKCLNSDAIFSSFLPISSLLPLPLSSLLSVDGFDDVIATFGTESCRSNVREETYLDRPAFSHYGYGGRVGSFGGRA